MGHDIRHLSIFANLGEEHLKSLEILIETITYAAGETVIQQNSPADYFYIILEGKVQISFKPYDGSSITISHIEKGELFGWSAVIGSERYTSSATAIEPLEAIRIDGARLRKLLVENPKAGQEILNSLANSVSTRWKDAREQVRLMLENGMR